MAENQDARASWLLMRVDEQCLEAIDQLLRRIAEHVAVATADAVTVRVLSADGATLLPLIAHYPEPAIATAMENVMAETVQPAEIGLWESVIRERKPRSWRTNAPLMPAEASPQQVRFLKQFAVRAVLAVPLLARGRPLGGLSLVRYVVDRSFTAQDEELAMACGRRIAATLDYRNAVVACGHPTPASSGHGSADRS